MRHLAPPVCDAPLRSSVLLLIICLLPMQVMAAPPNAKNKPKPVILAPVETQLIFDKVEALGTTRSIESTNITSTVTEKVKAIHFTDGQKVKKGQILAQVYSPELVTAQKELFEAMKLKDTNPNYYSAVRNKLTGNQAQRSEPFGRILSRLLETLV